MQRWSLLFQIADYRLFKKKNWLCGRGFCRSFDAAPIKM